MPERRVADVPVDNPLVAAVACVPVMDVVPVLVVPLMLLTALVTILTLPRILATAASSFDTQWTLLNGYRHKGDWTGVGAKVLALIAVVIPVLGVSYIVSRMVKQIVTKNTT